MSLDISDNELEIVIAYNTGYPSNFFAYTELRKLAFLSPDNILPSWLLNLDDRQSRLALELLTPNNRFGSYKPQEIELVKNLITKCGKSYEIGNEAGTIITLLNNEGI